MIHIGKRIHDDNQNEHHIQTKSAYCECQRVLKSYHAIRAGNYYEGVSHMQGSVCDPKGIIELLDQDVETPVKL